MKNPDIKKLYEIKAGQQMLLPGVLPLGIAYQSGESGYAQWHIHRVCYELVVIVGGTACTGNYETSFQLNAGNVFLMPPDTVHYYAQCQNFSYYNLLFLQPMLRVGCFDLSDLSGYRMLFNFHSSGYNRISSILSVSELVLEQLVRCSENISTELAIRSSGWGEAVAAEFVKLMVILLRNCFRNDQGADPVALHIRNIETLINQDCTQRHTLKKLAYMANMSESSFSHHFTRITGVSPIEYLIRARLKKALFLLTFSHSINRVASECGFDDYNYFSRQFRQRVGMTPRAFRNHCRHEMFELSPFIARINGES